MPYTLQHTIDISRTHYSRHLIFDCTPCTARIVHCTACSVQYVVQAAYTTAYIVVLHYIKWKGVCVEITLSNYIVIAVNQVDGIIAVSMATLCIRLHRNHGDEEESLHVTLFIVNDCSQLFK